MILATIFSALLLAAPLVQEQAVQIIRESHLDTVEGRTAFLQGDLMRVLQNASALNGEIEALSLQVSNLSEAARVKAEQKKAKEGPWMEAANEAADVRQISELTETMNGKMSRLISLLPILQEALRVEEDLNGLDALLTSQEPLNEAQIEQLRHLANLCESVRANP